MFSIFKWLDIQNKTFRTQLQTLNLGSLWLLLPPDMVYHATLFAAALMVPNLTSMPTTVNRDLHLFKKST